MDNIVTVACGLLLAVMVGICYYGLRLAHFLRKEDQKLIDTVAELEENNRLLVLASLDRDETIEQACELADIYLMFMEDDLEMLWESLYIIRENCSEDTLKNLECGDSMRLLKEYYERMSVFLEKDRGFGTIPRCVQASNSSTE
ncbi:MAG: hypothetical protein RSD07_09465 [Angelakisella sp.]